MAGELLLLPGLLCDRRLWSTQAEVLADAAWCRIPDLAHCESIGAMAEAVLGEAGGRFSLAGFSMGGCVALEIVARAPRRVGRLALLSTNAAGLLPAVREHYQASIARIEAGALEEYLADAFRRYVAPGNAQDGHLRETFFAMGRTLGPVVAVRQMRALLAYPGFCGKLGEIALPTLLVCGAEDRRTPLVAHEEMARQISGAELTVIEGSGHFTPLERPAAVTRALRAWLARPEGLRA